MALAAGLNVCEEEARALGDLLVWLVLFCVLMKMVNRRFYIGN